VVGGVGAVRTAEANRVTLEIPRAWGLVCANAPGTLTAYFGAGTLTDATQALGRIWIDNFALQNQTASFEVKDVTTANQTTGGSACANRLFPGVNPSPIVPAQVRVYATTATGADGFVYLTESVTYDVAAVEGLDGLWIRRNSIPFAGPVANADGLRFTYRTGAGGQTAVLDQIRNVEIAVAMQSSGKVNNRAQTSAASTTVSLRNR
jgi:hypothetical protein